MYIYIYMYKCMYVCMYRRRETAKVTERMRKAVVEWEEQVVRPSTLEKSFRTQTTKA